MTVINHNSITALLVILATCHTQGFFLDGDRVESRSTNLTQNTILGLFDTVTGLTHGIGGIFDQFEQGFESIRPRNQTVLDKVYVSEEEGSGSSVSDEESDSSLGSKAVVGLFDSLRNLNRNVGKLVDIVGDTLSERREDIADIATNVDTRVWICSYVSFGISSFIILGVKLRPWLEKKLWISYEEEDEERVRREDGR